MPVPRPEYWPSRSASVSLIEIDAASDKRDSPQGPSGNIIALRSRLPTNSYAKVDTLILRSCIAGDGPGLSR